MGTGIKKEWYLGGGEWTERELVGIRRRMKQRNTPPENITNIEEAKAKRTTGGKRSWSMKRGDEAKAVGR
jgi:hypothetical protein